MTLKQDKQRRLLVLNEVIRGRLTAWRAGELLGLRRGRSGRLLATYREERVLPLPTATGGAKRERVAELARTKYAGFNQLHMAEMLAYEEKLPWVGAGWGACSVRLSLTTCHLWASLHLAWYIVGPSPLALPDVARGSPQWMQVFQTILVYQPPASRSFLIT